MTTFEPLPPSRSSLPVKRQDRSGQYAVLGAIAIVTLFGFAALSVDIANIRLAQVQVQDVADAASQAAVYELRRTQDTVVAQEAAQAVVDANYVAGAVPDLADIDFGRYDSQTGAFTETAVAPNSARVVVTREDEEGITALFSKLWGYQKFDVRGDAISAAREVEIILVTDITNSWSQANFANARAASIAFLDTLKGSYSPRDRVGMSIFTNRFGWEFTPLTDLEVEVSTDQVLNQWTGLRTASKATDDAAGQGTDSCTPGSDPPNDFTTVPGGCYPNMPREYTDEPGTDHSTGLEMAWQMFNDSDGDERYRAVVVLTDGIPNGLGGASGTLRAAEGYTEPWDEYQGPVPKTAQNIRDTAAIAAERIHDDFGADIYVVSFVANDAILEMMEQGNGYTTITSDTGELVSIFEGIANSLPIAVVQ